MGLKISHNGAGKPLCILAAFSLFTAVCSQGWQDCRIPLGMVDKTIRDTQINAASIYGNKTKYAPYWGRLNYRGGYRADPHAQQAWILVQFFKPTIITGIATQGYGIPAIQEWLVKYFLGYTYASKTAFFTDRKDSITPKQFSGNSDSNSIVLHYVPVPQTVDRINIIPIKWHGNFAIRFELYGCLADGYECISTPCHNNGTCVDLVAGYHCNCTVGFNGTNCQYNIDDCAAVTCQHGGNCTDLVNDYSCQCSAGYSGKHCEIDVDECASSPCLHEGTCRDVVNGYVCMCTKGFGGANCHEETGFFLVVWLQIKMKLFSTEFLDKTSTKYRTTATQVHDEMTKILSHDEGFLSAHIRRFRPGDSLMVEVQIECLINSTVRLMNTTRLAVIKRQGIFKDDYFMFENTAKSDCQPPNVILYLSKSMATPTDVSRYLNISISMQATITCKDSHKALYVAAIYSIDNTTGIIKQVFKTHGNLATNTSWTIPAKALHYGIHYVKVTSSIIGKLDMNSIAWGFIRVGETKLLSRITSRNVTYQGAKEIFYLNGSESYDPDIGPGNYKGIEFIWLCRRDNENFTGDPTTLPIVRPNAKPQLDHGGCYGNGVGRLAQTKGQQYIVGLDVDMMKGNTRYVIALVVKKDERTTWSQQSVFVKEEITIVLACVQNCLANVIPTERLVLEQRCEGLLCDKINSYLWTLNIFDSATKTWINLPNVNDYILTYINSPNLVTKENTLSGNSSYVVTLTAKAPENIVDSSTYRFTTNAPPKGGRCEVDTSEGKAWLTYFGFSCFGWKDRDLPLFYKFRYNTSDGIDMVFFSGNSNFVRARLPVGDSKDEFTLNIEILVSDAIGSAAVVWIHVKVYEPEITSVGLEEAVGAQGDMNKYLQDNNIEMAAQHATSVLSVVNNASPKDLKLTRKIKIKDSIVKSWSSINVKNLEELGQVSAVVSAVSEKKAEVSMESQQTLVKLLQGMASVLEEEVDKKDHNEIRIQNVGSGLLQGIANVMEIAAWNASAANVLNRPIRVTRDTESGYKNRESISLVTKTVKLVDEVANSLVKTKKLYEKPTVFKTKSLSMVLDRQKPALIGNKAIQDGDTTVVIPPLESLVNNQQDTKDSFLSSQLVSMATNPFSWDASADHVKSSVMDFKLKTSTGSNVEVNKLDQDFGLFIPVPKPDSPVKPGSYFVKPSQNGSMQYHVINIPGKEYAVSIRLRPLSNINVSIYVRYGARPSVDAHNYTATLPDYETCNSSSVDGYFNCTSDPFTVVISSTLTGHVGIHYLGIEYHTPTSENATEPPRMRTKRDCFSQGDRQKRALCVQVKDPPPTTSTVDNDVPRYDPTRDVNYTLSVTMATCLYWDVVAQKWTSHGCKVGPLSKVGLLHCLCNHLTSFGGNFFVAPNPIDFDKVLQRFTDFDAKNFVVFMVVFGIFGLYLVALVIARRADRKDEVKAVETLRLSSSADYHYEISIYTGMWRNNGTTANVAIKLYGEQGESDALYLSDRYSKRKLFARASINNFVISLPGSLGEIMGIKLWHDNEGDNPSWYVTQVVIHDIQDDTSSYMICNRWLAVEKEDGEVQANFPVSTKEDLSSFRYQFSTRISKNLGDGHLWLSVVTRPPHSPFTRVQRVSCCLSVLYCAMLASAMFYQFGETNTGDTYKFGALRFSVRQLVIGLQSALVIVPVNILIVTIFRNTRLPQKPRHGNYSPKDKKLRAKPPGCLPHLFLYVGWFLCIASVGAAGTVTILYSLSWGGELSNEWLTSVLIAFLQDIGVIQPIKVVALAIVLALIIKKPQEEKTSHSLEKANLEVNERVTIEPPQGEKLEEARSYSNSVVETFRAVGEIVLYLLFVFCLMVFVYQNRGYDRYRLTRSIEEIFSSSFKEIGTTKEFWKWTKDNLVPGLYQTNWYTPRGPKLPEGYISNKQAFLVGMPRFRQIRLKRVSPCEVTKVFPWSGQHFSHCLPLYEPKYEERTRFNLPRWIPVQNTSTYGTLVNLRRLCPKPWRYQSSKELNTFSVEGVQTTYDGGGYVADLGYNSLTALNVIADLESNNWINKETAVLVTEFTVFEPSSSLFSHVRFLLEMVPPTGKPVLSTKLETLSLYESQDPSFRSMFLVVQILLLLFIFVYLISEIVKIQRLRCRYFLLFWNWMNLIQLLAAIAATVLFFFKATFVSSFIKHVQANPYETTSMDYVLLWCNIELYVISIIIFVVTIKFLRLLRFNRHICQMTAAMKYSFGRITSYTFVFLIDMISFGLVGVLVFGPVVKEYSNLVQSLRSLFQNFLGGDLLFEELNGVNRVIGPLFVFVYMVTMTFILVNMFVAILNDSYDSVRSLSGGKFPDSDLGTFMQNYYKRQFHLAHDTLKRNLGKIGYRTKHYEPNKEEAKQRGSENGSCLVGYSSLSSQDFPLGSMNRGFSSESVCLPVANDIYTIDANTSIKISPPDPEVESLNSEDIALETETTASVATTTSAEILDMISELPESLVDDEDTVDVVRDKLSNVGAILRISKRTYRRFSITGDKFVVERNFMVGQPVELKFTPKTSRKLRIDLD